MLTAALVTGFAVAGVSALTGPAAGHVDGRSASAARTGTAADATQVVPTATGATVVTAPTGSDAGAPMDFLTPAAAAQATDPDTVAVRPQPQVTDPTQISAVRGERKTRPRPRITAPVATWVNPMPEGAVTSCFGPRWGRLHAGVDIAAPHGTPIRAAGAGVVVSAGAAEGYGNAVLIDHGNGFLTHYGHMSTITVQPGQRVEVGGQIGNEGSTGHSTGPHLHFEVHQGHYQNPVEPTRWLREHGVEVPGCAQPTPRPTPVRR